MLWHHFVFSLLCILRLWWHPFNFIQRLFSRGTRSDIPLQAQFSLMQAKFGPIQAHLAPLKAEFCHRDTCDLRAVWLLRVCFEIIMLVVFYPFCFKSYLLLAQQSSWRNVDATVQWGIGFFDSLMETKKSKKILWMCEIFSLICRIFFFSFSIS